MGRSEEWTQFTRKRSLTPAPQLWFQMHFGLGERSSGSLAGHADRRHGPAGLWVSPGPEPGAPALRLGLFFWGKGHATSTPGGRIGVAHQRLLHRPFHQEHLSGASGGGPRSCWHASGSQRPSPGPPRLFRAKAGSCRWAALLLEELRVDARLGLCTVHLPGLGTV